ncbi:amino acid ABC transporter permease/ATP-binding protein [Mycetocola reblochoni]|uniref:Methionine ABC transporter ATP-binding protein n=2 Tax=Mycetocola reblochoni TaxID=331618 RepID=A0A1R4JXC4_9MICO|nr:ABC transporter permease subunit [Mycetocola reblochoni]RLP70607.1 ATP-binding cassette domain-containing protein [Mycetocola reblochoni]SJN36622.1 Methionine ABC transporter ATP-binding protein [Mycetocola reblochoni REB411]
MDITGFLHYLTLPYLVEGLLVTLQLTAFGFLGGMALGAVLAAMQLTRFRTLTVIARCYTTLYRGTPLILQLVFTFTVLPHAGVVLTPIVAGSLALALNEATFFSEIFRSGIRGVDQAQTTAGRALGLGPGALMRRVTAPQAFRQMVPALGNEAVATMKNSALASIIAVPELTLRTQQLASSTFDYFEIYVATAVLYLLLTGAITGVQLLVERRSVRIAGVRSRPLARRKRGRAETTAASTAGLGRGPGTPPELAGPVEVVEMRGGAPAEDGRPEARGAALALTGIVKRYGERTVLDGVDLAAQPGEVVALLGPSGSGKSTLLRIIDQLETRDSGTVTVNGAELGIGATGRRHSESRLAAERVDAGVSMVFQNFALFSHLSVAENVAGPLRWVHGWAADAAAARAHELLGRVGLGEYADAAPASLSGGQQQRVAIARAIAARPRLLLLDEPTSALDPELVAEVLRVITSLARDEGLTMVLATHQLRFARQVADTAVFMAGGRVVETGPAERVIGDPSTPQAVTFMTAMNAAEV